MIVWRLSWVSGSGVDLQVGNDFIAPEFRLNLDIYIPSCKHGKHHCVLVYARVNKLRRKRCVTYEVLDGELLFDVSNKNGML